jgi:hypothetical protein
MRGVNRQRPSCPLESWSPAIMSDNMVYHRYREQECREMAEHATDPKVRRRHEQLAKLHAHKALEREGLHH